MLIGGSPGPNAEGTWVGIVIVFVLCAAAGVAFLYVWKLAASMGGFYGVG